MTQNATDRQALEDDVEWLDEEEQAAWIALMSLILRLPAALERQLKADAGITHFDYLVMVILSEVPERTLRMSQLAELSGGSLPRLSQVVARLENAGRVWRHPHPEDGRTTLATLTDDGFEALAAAAPKHVTEVRRLVFDRLTKAQIGQLQTIAKRIVDLPCETDWRTIEPST